MDWDLALGIGVGFALAAACGFRVFVPLLVVSLAARAGAVPLAPGFEWLGSTPAVVALALATALEIAGYYIPWVDHVLDLFAAPAAVVAGTIVMASSLVGLDPFLKWTLALVAGGGIAGGIQLLTGALRLGSTATTGGLANPLLATAESSVSLVLSVLALLAPLAAALFAVVVLVIVLRRRQRVSAAGSR